MTADVCMRVGGTPGQGIGSFQPRSFLESCTPFPRARHHSLLPSSLFGPHPHEHATTAMRFCEGEKKTWVGEPKVVCVSLRRMGDAATPDSGGTRHRSEANMKSLPEYSNRILVLSFLEADSGDLRSCELLYKLNSSSRFPRNGSPARLNPSVHLGRFHSGGLLMFFSNKPHLLGLALLVHTCKHSADTKPHFGPEKQEQVSV